MFKLSFHNEQIDKTQVIVDSEWPAEYSIAFLMNSIVFDYTRVLGIAKYQRKNKLN